MWTGGVLELLHKLENMNRRGSNPSTDATKEKIYFIFLDYNCNIIILLLKL
jgi:hypothetical protein